MNKTRKRLMQTYREKLGLTRSQMAEKLGIKYDNIYSYETWTPNIISNMPLDVFLDFLLFLLEDEVYTIGANSKFFSGSLILDLCNEILEVKEIVRTRKNKKANDEK